ncbi:Cytochrome P450 93A3 [Senna tora]|uniref:Cytochrome P450 93A3 n=1 Tax=Senna tora TaxID=362788 RepID=A0A834SIB4_9FABA|nr:Cytochrome P450 93A3 [Senna tora]
MGYGGVNQPPKCHEKSETRAGFSRIVQESDVVKLPYLQAVVKETLRGVDPMEFKAERFISEESSGIDVVIHCFEWKVDGGNCTVDKQEKAGFTLPRAPPLILAAASPSASKPLLPPSPTPTPSVVGSTPPAAAPQPMSPFYQGGGGGGGYLSSLATIKSSLNQSQPFKSNLSGFGVGHTPHFYKMGMMKEREEEESSSTLYEKEQGLMM